MSDTRVSAKRQTARWDPDAEVSVKEAMDFWSFAGAAANVVMQLAWPEVGYGVAESKVDSGSILKHPWKRLRTTSQYLAVAVFGSDQDRAAFREAVDGAHRQVISAAGSPVTYNAFDRELQMWVAACLFVGLEDTYTFLRGEMTPEQADQFYRSASTLGTTLQVGDDQWPATRAEFDTYWDDACKHAVIDAPVRDYLIDLINLRMINPFWGYRSATAEFLTSASSRRFLGMRSVCDGARASSASSNGCSCWSPSLTGSFRCSSARPAATSSWPTSAGGPAQTEIWCDGVCPVYGV